LNLFKRAINLTVGTFEVSNLDIAFTVTKTLKPEPNTAEIRITNLSPDHRKAIQTPKKLPVRLEAGYVDNLASLYLGEMRSSESVIAGPDVITTLTSADSEDPLRKARLNVPIGAGHGADKVMLLLVDALGVNPGNAQQMVNTLKARGSAAVYGKRGVISGHVKDELNDLCRSAGIEWSIQDGKIQFLDLNQPTDALAVKLSSETGLVGSATVDNKGLAECTCLLIPQLTPGRKVSFETATLQGGYRIVRVEYSGDTFGTEWYAKLQCKKY
jgi:hypothetical protein